MHLLKKQHISPKHEAGFPFSQIYTKKLIIFLPFFFPLKIICAKESTCETLTPIRKVVNSLISRKVTLSLKHQVISSLQLTLEFGTNEKITTL